MEQLIFTCKSPKRSNLLHLIIIFTVSFSLFFSLAYSQIPDYDKPYSPIFTDRAVYTWTDKVVITIVAPSWNPNKFAIDSIGGDEEHFVKISTGKNSLKPYKLTETDVNSGTFVGEVILTGFSHDVDGDGKPDTNPRTIGNGPTNGFLETERDNSITVSFEFAEGVVLTHSAPISWNIGTIKFLEPQYIVGNTASIQVIDPDMNLNPETIDHVPVKISSDSDVAGITINALETNEDSGIFQENITFAQNSASSGNRLFAIPGDALYAKYEDRTLPQPYNVSDELPITTTSSFESNIPGLERTVIEKPIAADSSGVPLEELYVNNQLQIVSKITNTQNFDQNFVYIVQITNEDGVIVSLSWIEGEFSANQKLELSQSWMPTKAGKYTVETFVWNSLQKPTPISSPNSQTYFVK